MECASRGWYPLGELKTQIHGGENFGRCWISEVLGLNIPNIRNIFVVNDLVSFFFPRSGGGEV
jgi:hypothetical protein